MITAASLMPASEPLVTSVEIVGPGELLVTAYLADATEVTYRLEYSDRDGVEGDAPDSVLTAVERRLADGDAFCDEYTPDNGYRFADARLEAPL